jgi:hypothetical protein
MEAEGTSLALAARRMAQALGNASAQSGAPPSTGPEDIPPRQLFLELLAAGLATLYPIMPLGAPLFDRAIIKAITGHMPDADSTKIVLRAEDWIRLEGLVRGTEGQKSYTLSKEILAIMETETPEGSIGLLMEKARDFYSRQAHTPELRQATRRLAAMLLSLLARH